MYGWRARLGVLVPSGIVAIEPEFNRIIPEGVSCHYHRTAFTGGGLSDIQKAEEGILDAVGLLWHVHPSAVAVSGTALSFVDGYQSDRKLLEKIKTKYGNIPVTTTSTAVVTGLNKMRVRRISVATPYLEEVARAAAKFIADSGIEVLNLNWRGKKAALEIAEMSKESVYHLAKEVDTPQSEAIFISCTALHTLEIIELLEKDLQKPVISSNQATIWHLLRLANIEDKVQGYGSLLSK